MSGLAAPGAGPVSRRRLLSGALGLAALAAAGESQARPRRARLPAGAEPFTLGVAAGDPTADGFVIWTRLAPDPLDETGGMPPDPVPVTWEVAADEGFARVVQRGAVRARPEWAHAVHVELRGLRPDHGYWYRFRAGRAVSRVGRARTLPLPGASLGRLRLGVASCQHYEQGYFAAYRHMLADDLDLVLHLGDYIYENASWADEVRRHEGPEPVTLDQYRSRHALYKLDPDLQAAHAAYPWVLTWDDHEVDNDYAGPEPQDRGDPAAFLRRRAAAYQAYYEHMPLRRLARPAGPALSLYQRIALGDLVQLHVLDARQYRDDQACGDGGSGGGQVVEACPARLDPRRTMLGAEQERWLERGLERASTRWTAVAQAQLMAPLTQRGPSGRPGHWTDGWDGYPAARDRLLARLARAPNPVVLGGDIHSFWVTDLKLDFADPGAPTVATEFVGTSVTSAGVPYSTFAGYARDNPHVRFFDSRRRGYLRCEVTPARWQTDLRVLDDVRDPGTGATTLATFVVEAGRPGAQRAAGP